VLIVKGVTKMKTVYQNELIKVNKEIWENDIRKEISDWEDFSTSCFCDTEDRKQSAKAVIMKLHGMLETLLSDNGITEEQFQWFSTLIH